MTPDYTMSFSQVYTEATEYLLNESEGLLALSLVEGRHYRKTEGLPSWVPDYTVNFLIGIGIVKRNLYCTSKALKPEWQIQEGGSVLCLKASKIDAVCLLG